MIERIRFSYEIIEISRLKNTLWMRIRLWLKRICLDMIVRERTFDSKKDVLVCNESKQDVETSALTEWKNAICVRETFNRYTFFLDIIRDTCGLILFWWRNYVEKLKSRKVGTVCKRDKVFWKDRPAKWINGSPAKRLNFVHKLKSFYYSELGTQIHE